MFTHGSNHVMPYSSRGLLTRAEALTLADDGRFGEIITARTTQDGTTLTVGLAYEDNSINVTDRRCIAMTTVHSIASYDPTTRIMTLGAEVVRVNTMHIPFDT